MKKKSLFCIFTCLLFIILMSHNVMAVELVNDVEWIRGNHNIQIMPNAWVVEEGFCQGLASGAYSDLINCNGLTKLSDFNITIPSMSYKYGDWIVAEFFVNQNLNNVSNHMNFYGLQYAGSNPVDLAYTDISELNANSSKITLYFRAWGDFTDNNLRLTGKNGANAIIFNVANGTDSQLQFRCGLASVFRDKNPSNYTGSINDVKNSVNSINDTLKNQQQQQEQDENALNNAVNDANNSAESNTNQVEDATGDTQASIQSIVDVVLNTSPSDCKINANMGQIDLGELNMCSAPSSFLTIINSAAGIVGVIVTVNVGRKVIFDVQDIIMRVTNG